MDSPPSLIARRADTYLKKSLANAGASACASPAAAHLALDLPGDG